MLRLVSRLLPWSIAALAIAALPTLASAADQIVVGPFKADRSRKLTAQVAGAVCGKPHRCVQRSAVTRNGRIDLREADRRGVLGILSGTVTGRRVRLWLHVGTETQRDWRLQLNAKGVLPAAALARFRSELNRELEQAGGAAAETETYAEVPAPPAETRPQSYPSYAPSPQAPAAPPPPAVAQETYQPPPPAPRDLPGDAPDDAPGDAPGDAPEEGTAPWIAIELGAQMTQRSLGYAGTAPAGTRQLRKFQVPGMLAPRGRLQLHPMGLLGGGFLAGFGLYGEYERSIGLETRDDLNAGVKHPTFYSRFEAGALWRITPLSGSRLAFTPSVAFRRTLLVATPSIEGLPSAELAGVQIGLDGELPVGPVTILAGGGFVQFLQAADLVKGNPAYFPSGKVYALEARGGIDVGLGAGLSARLMADYSSVIYYLDPDPRGAYRATGAIDRYLGGRAMLRWEH